MKIESIKFFLDRLIRTSKTNTNIALEGTRSGNVVGGLYREPMESLQAFFSWQLNRENTM